MKKSHEPLTERIKKLPLSPGVYLMKDEAGEIIYIGKASSLKKRVSSYFQKTDIDLKTRTLVSYINEIEVIVTDTEIEALILEDSLIKKHKPKFNIRLKDDKKYPYIAVTLSEEYPRAIFTRDVKNRKNRYFGPYTNAKSARNTVMLINTLFRLKGCTKKIPFAPGERPCLNHQIEKCSGICTAMITRDEYLELVQNAEHFLEGDIDPIIELLTRKMRLYSERMMFERAADMRNMIFDIQKISEKQNISLSRQDDADYLAIETRSNNAFALVFEFRKGVLSGRKIRIFENSSWSEKESIIRSFIIHHYETQKIPHVIITDTKTSETDVLENWLSDRAKKRIHVTEAKSGDDRGVMNMVHRNLDMIIAEKEAESLTESKLIFLQNLQKLLFLDSPPLLMVCFDISNFQGTDAVASMACFRNGEPFKPGYRHYKIRSVEGANDPAMIHEAVGRYLAHVVNGEWEQPDLIVIDGGVTQLTKAIEARDAFDCKIPIVSIAKREELIYVDPHKDPVRISHANEELKIIQRLRDATHDFGVSHHRKLRSKRTLTSELDKVRGIGPAKKKVLLAHFSTPQNVLRASREELSASEILTEKEIDAIILLNQNSSGQKN